MDEQQPFADEPFDDDVYVRAWWQRSEHLHGEHRDDKAAYALDWAENGVMHQMRRGDPVSAVSLLDRLLDAPGADPEIVAHNPLQELLEDFRPPGRTSEDHEHTTGGKGALTCENVDEPSGSRVTTARLNTSPASASTA